MYSGLIVDNVQLVSGFSYPFSKFMLEPYNIRFVRVSFVTMTCKKKKKLIVKTYLCLRRTTISTAITMREIPNPVLVMITAILSERNSMTIYVLNSFCRPMLSLSCIELCVCPLNNSVRAN